MDFSRAPRRPRTSRHPHHCEPRGGTKTEGGIHTDRNPTPRTEADTTTPAKHCTGWGGWNAHAGSIAGSVVKDGAHLSNAKTKRGFHEGRQVSGQSWADTAAAAHCWDEWSRQQTTAGLSASRLPELERRPNGVLHRPRFSDKRRGWRDAGGRSLSPRGAAKVC